LLINNAAGLYYFTSPYLAPKHISTFSSLTLCTQAIYAIGAASGVDPARKTPSDARIVTILTYRALSNDLPKGRSTRKPQLFLSNLSLRLRLVARQPAVLRPNFHNRQFPFPVRTFNDPPDDLTRAQRILPASLRVPTEIMQRPEVVLVELQPVPAMQSDCCSVTKPTKSKCLSLGSLLRWLANP